MRQFIAVALLLVACGRPQISTHPAVIIDEAFAVDEIGGVLTGLTEWEIAAPELHFDRRVMGHAQIIGAALEGADDTIFIVRVDYGQAGDCPNRERHLAAGTSAGTYHEVVCLDASEIAQDVTADPWRTTTEHELGHAMGLQHSAPGNVMAWRTDLMAISPTDQDVVALRSLR